MQEVDFWPLHAYLQFIHTYTLPHCIFYESVYGDPTTSTEGQMVKTRNLDTMENGGPDQQGRDRRQHEGPKEKFTQRE